MEPTRSNEHSRLIPDPPDEARGRAITEIIVQVEILKQLPRPINDEERNALMRCLADTGESIGDINKRAQRLVRRPTYGNIAFEHWMIEEETTSILQNRMPTKEPDWLCLDCQKNHHWNEICPKVEAELKALPPASR